MNVAEDPKWTPKWEDERWTFCIEPRKKPFDWESYEREVAAMIEEERLDPQQ
jgi:hypothetical protein